jgi:hypothetical protein
VGNVVTFDHGKGYVFLMTGFVGVILPIVMEKYYRRHVNTLFESAGKLKESKKPNLENSTSC